MELNNQIILLWTAKTPFKFAHVIDLIFKEFMAFSV